MVVLFAPLNSHTPQRLPDPCIKKSAPDGTVFSVVAREGSLSLIQTVIYHQFCEQDFRIKLIIFIKTRPAGFPAGRWRLWLQVGRDRIRLGGLGLEHIEHACFEDGDY